MSGRAEVFGVGLNNDAVLNHGDACGAIEFAVFVSRLLEDDVVGLPLAGRPADVHLRRVLPVDRARFGHRRRCRPCSLSMNPWVS